ncbi:MAG: cysteine synthase family protein [Saprospiraceae bacterium]|nr:cysteine synthase family protein [Saprospiraceae bacterium]
MGSSFITQTDFDLLLDLQQVSRKIGRTPVHAVRQVFSKPRVQVFAKMEWAQLSGSVKARAAFNIIYSAIQNGLLHRGKTLLDATSGNTGIAYAAIGKELGIRVALCLPENASAERKEILKSLGAEIIYTSKFEGTDGAQQVALELATRRPDLYYYADQYKNEHNWKAHYHHTSQEIIQAFPQITHFVCGLGTTGTFVGTGKRLKELSRKIQLTALQPDSALHGMEGWKHLETAIVPGIYDEYLADTVEEIDTLEAYEMIKDAKKHEGILLSPSAAANLVGAIKVAQKLDSGTVVTVFADNADKYGDVIKRLF